MTIISNKIDQYIHKKIRLQILAGFVNLIVLLSIIWVSTLSLDMTFYFDSPTRWIVLLVNGGLSIILCYIFIIRILLHYYFSGKEKKFVTAAKEIGTHQPQISDRLANLYQLENSMIPDYAKTLRDHATSVFSQKIEKVNFNKFLHYSNFSLPKHVIFLVFFATISITIFLHEPMLLSFKRVLFPYKSFSELPQFTFKVIPGNSKVIKGESANIQANYSGPEISGCTIEYKNESDQYWQTASMVFGMDHYNYELENVRNEVSYRLKGNVISNKPWKDKIVSETFTINTIMPPEITELQIEITPPKYSQLPAQFAEKNIGDIVAYRGSICKLSARVNKNIRQAQVYFSSSDSVRMVLRDKKLSGKFTIKKHDSYYFKLIDESDVTNQNPIEYTITLLDDYYPSVTILEPEEDIESIPDAIIAIKIEANDDFGLSKMSLNYQIIDLDSGEDSSFVQINLPFKFNSQKVFSNSYVWDLSELPIGFDETLKYYITVWDNDVVSGPKFSKSGLHYIRFPSLDQLFEDFASVEEKNIEELEDMTDVNEELKKELEKIQREFKQDKKLDWERKKQIESTLKKQNDLQKKLEQIEQEIDEAVKKLAEKNLFSPEVLEKYNQLQELFQEIASPELLEAMQELQKSIESVDKRKVEQALNQMKINQEKFKEKLERTLELFKKIQLEQELDRLVQTAERMTQKQNDITKDLNDPNKTKKDDLNNLEQSQKQQSENLEQLNESAQDLLDDKMLKEFQEAWEKLKEAFEKTNQQQLSQQMQQMQQQLSKQNVNQAKSTSQSLEQQLEMLKQQLKQSQAAMNKQNKEQTMAKMQKTTNNLLQLSKDEEALMQETKELSNFSDDFRNKAQTQKEISDNLRKVIKDMIELSKETFFLSPKTNQIMGNAFGNMDKGLNALEERNKKSASQFQKDAMASLNQAIMEMQNSMQSMSQSSSGLGFEQFMQQMQNMAGQQGQLNEQGMDFLQQQGNSGQLSLQQQGELERMAAQQEALRKSMQKLGNEVGDRSDILGRMDKMGEEMEKVVKEMQAMKYDRRTIERQQNILSRMLDATKSVREREYSRKRKAEVGKQYARRNPPAITESVDEKRDRLRKDLKKALEEGYSIDYEKLIEEYFKNLNQNIEQN